jgi:hypothetical protein
MKSEVGMRKSEIKKWEYYEVGSRFAEVGNKVCSISVKASSKALMPCFQTGTGGQILNFIRLTSEISENRSW